MFDFNGDYVVRYVVRLQKNGGGFIEYTTTAKCDYMAVAQAENRIAKHSTAKYTAVAVCRT